jgi:hypothetical protein
MSRAGSGQAAATSGPPVASVPSAPLAAAPVRKVTVRISPTEAHVTVRGAPRLLSASGELALEGEVGESFTVEVEARGVSRQTHVVISRDGVAEPSAIELPPPAAQPSATTTTTAATPPTATVARTAKPGPTPSRVETASPRPTAAPTEPKLHGDL